MLSVQNIEFVRGLGQGAPNTGNQQFKVHCLTYGLHMGAWFKCIPVSGESYLECAVR